jgi:RNA polymerase sigma-70 factor (ECF subfamily)
MSSQSSSYFHRPPTVSTYVNPDDDLVREEFRGHVESIDSRLRHFLLTLTSNPDDAEDVLQDTYEVAWRRFSDFQRGTNFYHWVAKIGFNLSRNFNRKRRKNRGMGLSDEVLLELARVDSGNHELLEMREQYLPECLGQLRIVDQALLLDSYRDEHPRPDLAKRYAMREDTLHKRLFRLRKRLYNCINSKLGFEGR